MTISKLQVGSWDVSFVDDPAVIFPRWAVAEGLGILNLWQQLFPTEDTWVRRTLGIPSLIVRLDCVIDSGRLHIYEIEERPAGIGITSHINPQFHSLFSELIRSWPQVSVLVSPKRTGSDDYMWAPTLDIDSHDQQVIIVRAEPDEAEFHRLEPFSASSLRHKGSKVYGVGLGWWESVRSGDTLPWDRGFVVKPTQGSKCRGIEIWLPKPLCEQYKGGSTRARVERTLAAQGEMFLQPFHPPMRVNGNLNMEMAMRVFFGYSPETQDWVCLGGTWNARQNVRIHGSSDAVFGPVVLD